MSAYTIWIDGREKISMRHMRGYRTSFSFESYSGADCLITNKSDVLRQDNFQEFLDAGAIMIQVKHSADLSNSITDGRLFEALARMNSYEAHSYQRGLLVTGEFKRVRNDLYIDGRRSNVSWSSYIGAWDAWVLRGGVVYPVMAAKDMQHFIDSLAHKTFIGDPFIQHPAPRKRKKFQSQQKFTKNMRLSQKVRLATKGIDEHDMRHILINFDSMTHRTVQGVYEYMKDRGVDFNMSNFIELALSDKITDIKGIGKVTASKIRKQLGYK